MTSASSNDPQPVLADEVDTLLHTLSQMFASCPSAAAGVRQDLMLIARGRLPVTEMPVDTIHEIRTILAPYPLHELAAVLAGDPSRLFTDTLPSQ